MKNKVENWPCNGQSSRAVLAVARGNLRRCRTIIGFKQTGIFLILFSFKLYQMFYKLITTVLLLLPAAVFLVPETERAPVYVSYADKGFNFPDLLEASQMQLDQITSAYKLVWGEAPGGQRLLEMHLAGENTMFMNTNKTVAHLMYTMAAIHANDLPYFVAQVVSQMK